MNFVYKKTTTSSPKKTTVIRDPYLNIMESRSNGYSMIPVVGALALKMSCSVGR